MGARRKAREYALMILYQMDVSGSPLEPAIRRFFETVWSGEPLDPRPPFDPSPPQNEASIEESDEDARAYAEKLVRGVSSSMANIDKVIQGVSIHWRLDRMACVDRNLLRLGAYEMTELADQVPRNVVINEAVEIAKRFGSQESSAFINGLLDRIGKGDSSRGEGEE